MSDVFYSRTRFVPRTRRTGATTAAVYTMGITDRENSEREQTSSQDLTQLQPRLVFDDKPTSGSSNPVTSDGIYLAFCEVDNQFEEFSEAVRQELDKAYHGGTADVEELTATEVLNIWNSITD